MNIELTADAPVLRLEGEVNIYFAYDLKQSLLAQLGEISHSTSTLTLDFNAVTALDTAGIQLLELVRREAEHAGHKMRLIGVSPAIEAYISKLNLGPRFGLEGGAWTH